MKEPGQLAYEATPAVLTWEQQPEAAKALWAITEAVIRADERAAVIEECAKVAERMGKEAPSGPRVSQSFHIADEIRALAPVSGFNEPEPHTPQYPPHVVPTWKGET